MVTLSAGQHYLEPANGHERTRRGEEGGESNVRKDVEKYDVYLYRIFIHAREGNII